MFAITTLKTLSMFPKDVLLFTDALRTKGVTITCRVMRIVYRTAHFFIFFCYTSFVGCDGLSVKLSVRLVCDAGWLCAVSRCDVFL